MIKKTVRNLTVTCQSYYRNIFPPIIIMKGAWLNDWGFEQDTPIAVYCENDKLTIVKQDNKKRVRLIKVYEKYVGNKLTTVLLLKGKWLKKWGFDFGTSVAVRCEYGKLIITKKGAEEEDGSRARMPRIKASPAWKNTPLDACIQEGQIVFLKGALHSNQNLFLFFM